MELRLYQVDAFTGAVFKGNPAAVVPLPSWPADRLLQAIAMENNLSETAFYVGASGNYELRWFTPLCEVDLCGHATLATAAVLCTEEERGLKEARFSTRSGELRVRALEDTYELDFPSKPPRLCEHPPQALLDGLGIAPREVYQVDDWMAVYDDEEQVRALNPDMRLLRSLSLRGVIATAPGKEADFVSRFFAPAVGIDEDPVTGSAHCLLTPFWSTRLGKMDLFAQQLSRRGGTLHCTLQGDRVLIAGRCALYLRGSIFVKE